MVQRRSLMFFMGSLGIMTLLYACSTPHTSNTAEQEPATVEIDRKVHFLTPSGEDVVVLPGAYEVKAEKFGLRLIAEEGIGDESLLIEANATEHEESVTHPMALMLSDKKDNQVITLPSPEWQGMGSMGNIEWGTFPAQLNAPSRLAHRSSAISTAEIRPS